MAGNQNQEIRCHQVLSTEILMQVNNSLFACPQICEGFCHARKWLSLLWMHRDIVPVSWEGTGPTKEWQECCTIVHVLNKVYLHMLSSRHILIVQLTCTIITWSKKREQVLFECKQITILLWKAELLPTSVSVGSVRTQCQSSSVLFQFI